jgi:hypothetical protein
MTTTNKTLDLGNNESATRGVFAQADGTFVALTYTESKSFKTCAGADNWFAKRETRRAAILESQARMEELRTIRAKNLRPKFTSFLRGPFIGCAG